MINATRLTTSLCLDQRQRWRRGDPVLVESYLERHPSLADHPEGILDLIYTENVLRDEAGESPRLEEYQRRFAHFDAQLRLLFEVHQALEREAPSQAGSPPGSQTPLPGGGHLLALPTELPAVPGYDILAELGRGGMGVVYKARQQSLNRVVALKMLPAGPHPADRGLVRFQAEAGVIARLQHPNIVQVYEVGAHDGRPFFALEFVAGRSLAARIAGSPQPAAEAARTVATLARAMHYAHQQGVVHRDLKPANVLLADDGTPKVSDFGLAKVLDAGGQTQTGDIMGTPSYMAPEQAGKGHQVGPAADVYALGAILYEMLTGRPPFKGETPMDTLLQILHEDPVPPSRLRPRTPRDLETTCLKCLEKSPRRRYASAADLADDLQRFLDGRPVTARRITPAGRALKWARRRPAAAALLTLLAAAFLGLAVFLPWHAARESRRLAALRPDLVRHLDETREALSRKEWAVAQAQLTGVLSRVRPEPSLADLRQQAERLLADAEDGRYAGETYQKFAGHRDQALFHRMELLSHGASQGTLPTGMGEAAQRKAVEDAARQALAVVGVDIDARGPWEPDPRFRNPARRAEIAADCSTLLLVLADVTAERPGGAGPDEPGREALRILDRAMQLGPRTQVHHLRRAAYLRRLGDEAGAKEEAEQAAALRPAGAEEYFLLGDDHYKRGNLAAAVRAFESAVGLRPDHFWAECCLGRCYLDRREWEKARACLTACLVQRPDVVWPYLLRGFANREAGALVAAEADFRKAQGLLQGGGQEEALYELYVHRGLLRRLQGKLEEAAVDLRQAIRLRPDAFGAYINLARVLQQQHRQSEAAEQLAEAVRLRPPALVLADYHAERGRDLWKERQYREAVAECRSALQCRQDYPLALGVLGLALLGLEQYEEAARAFDRYLAVGGKPLGDIFRGRGTCRMKRGDYLGARDDFTRVLELRARESPADAETYAHRGWAYFFAEAWQPALRDFHQALRLDPAYGDAYTGRGLARVMLGRYREAVRDADEALRRGPTRPEMMHNLACVFAQAVARAHADAAARDRAALAAGYREQALKAVRQTLALLPPGGRRTFLRDSIAPDPALDPIRQEPGFQQLLKEYGLSGTPR